ncbi:MAG: excinuclease ABC subunit UvrA [Gemmatimonadales bacterium]
MLHPMPTDKITIRGARQHNLKGITVEIPRRALTVVTGPSGSGKSSLAFDTIYAEGQRRYIESLSSYAKQFLERLSRPNVDRVEGVSPAVAIEQKNPTTSSRSTVGTATEVHDYLRLLWARIGHAHCYRCDSPVVVDSPTTATDRLLLEMSGTMAVIGFAIPHSSKVSHQLILENLRAMGFVRVMISDELHRLEELPPNVRLDTQDITVAVDRLKLSRANRGRIVDSIATAFAEGDGEVRIVTSQSTREFSQHACCTNCGTPAPPLSPALFSFNNPRGACQGCNGFGAVLDYDESLIVPDPNRTLAGGALDPWTKPRYTRRRRLLRDTATRENIPLDVPWCRLSKPQRRLLLFGKSGRFVGVCPFLRALERKRYKQYIRVFLRQYQRASPCPECNGSRLRPEALAVTIADKSIGEISSLTAAELSQWLASVELTDFEQEVASTIMHELRQRVSFLCDVGLGYLSFHRLTRTLSGGEAQRIALSNALGASLVDTLYVLDEPSIGLHPRDITRLLGLLKRLCASGNTAVVVEHDTAAMRVADHMIELGPGSGEGGGELVYCGPVAGAEDAGTLTGKYLTGEKRIAVPSARRPVGPAWLSIEGATLHNLHDVNVTIPLGGLVVVTGVSGSGKSTLVHDILYRQLAVRIKGTSGAKRHLGEPVGHVANLTGWEALTDVVMIDQSPVGRTPRSNPVTYVRAFTEIRDLFAAQPLSRARGYTPGTFSFNAVKGGRCHACEGAGHLQIEMVFLADVYIPCDACGATRFEPEVLDVRVKGLSIHDVLQLTVDEAIVRFRHQKRLGKTLWHLQQVGLGYLKLGQPATTLSGGEAQRLKIARQLAGARRRGDRRLYILDEPTTGLHLDDLRVLIKVLDHLVDAGHTVLVIEHHMDVIKRADWVIDMGPEGGSSGGRIVAAGTPEAVAEADTHTARYLSEALAASQEPGTRAAALTKTP